MKKAIVIGAGIGGLAAAVTLQSRGIHTMVFDENPHAGGKMMSVNVPKPVTDNRKDESGTHRHSYVNEER